MVTALLLQRQLSMRRYETAFMMLHKLRRAIVNSAREPLTGEIKVDAWVGGPQARLCQRLIGTHHGFSREHVQVYLDELVFHPTDAGCRWQVSKRHSASVPRARLRITA